MRERFSFQLSRYHDLVADGRPTVDETTWQDLAMDEVFAKVDRTSGFPGRQILYHQMRTYETEDRVLAERARQHTVFRSDSGFREAVQARLAGLGDSDAAWLAPLLMNDFMEKPQWAWALHFCGLAPLACFIGMAWWPVLLIPGVCLGLVNLVINETYGRRITPYLGGLSQIHRLMRVAEGLSTLPDAHRLPQLEALRRTTPERDHLRKRLGWLAMDREKLGDLVMSAITYANLFFLVDIQIYLGSLLSLRRHQAALVDMLEAVGTLDAAISVASYMDGLPVVVTPALTQKRHIEAVGLYHPLLADAVGNPIRCDGRSILITGSNMAGKTTFLRTVGINVILAQTLNLCLAKQATMPRARVRSSIRQEDRLARGESLYAVELERIRDMIQDAEGEALHLFLLDEIFRGTNTLERISAATAVLHHLGESHLVMVTTHDLELQDLLEDGYDMYHFSEQIVEGGVGFDYRIKSGPTTGRNAIQLLEIRGYPESITREARRMADRLAAP
ncbi:MAG TPA: hypothetical protein VGK03_13670 [Geothrix sp.]